jgi:hypothetical protein
MKNYRRWLERKADFVRGGFGEGLGVEDENRLRGLRRAGKKHEWEYRPI